MFRLRLICRYFDGYTDSSISPISFGNKLVSREKFVGYLVHQKNFAEDVLQMLKRWISFLLGRWVLQGGRGLVRIRKQVVTTEDCIDECIKRGLLISMNSHGQDLRMDHRGRRFIRLLPFFNEVLKEYGYITSFIFGSGGTLIFTFLIKYFAKFFV